MDVGNKHNMKTAILINSRDRVSELTLLLQSLRTQSHQDFDVFILDDASGTPFQGSHFFNCLVNRLKNEGHRVFMKRNNNSMGVVHARQNIVDWVKSTTLEYTYYLRADDDVVLEPDYIEKLISVIGDGYDMASGVTVPMMGGTIKRDPEHLNGIANRIILDEEGNYIMNGDDCGIEYLSSLILPAHHFRSCVLYKAEIHDKANYLPTRLSQKHGFREEQIFSYRCLLAGFTIGVDTGAINYHQMTPSGGERTHASQDLINFNQKQFLEFTKKYKDELKKLFPNEPMPSKLALTKQNNLLMK